MASTVFREMADHPLVSEGVRARVRRAWEKLNATCHVAEFPGRFPAPSDLEEAIDAGATLVGCHLSHPIPKVLLERGPVEAVCTSTAGYDHVETPDDDSVLVTHAPGVLQRAVADFTVTAILASLRNLLNLHEFVWSGAWSPDERWDLDQKLARTVDRVTVGVVGMGEIGTEVTRRLSAWGVRLKYHDPVRRTDVEAAHPNVEYSGKLESVFSDCDVVSLHVPLTDATRGLVNARLLKLMKPGALLVNTSRGGVVNFDDLLDVLESGEARVNLAFDVFDPEPIPPGVLDRFKKIQARKPELKFLFVPHNASADADTRGQMAAMLLEDLATLATAQSFEDVARARLIPRHRRDVEAGNVSRFRIGRRFGE